MEKGESSKVVSGGKSWVDIISDPANDLKFINILEAALKDGVLKLPKEVLAKGKERLKAAVVIQFLGVPPPFRFLASVVNRLWGYEGQVIVSTLQENFFLVEFKSVKLCEWVLSRSWHIHNKSMIMRRWESGIQHVVFSENQAPEWIIFKNVPPDVISVEGVIWLCSLIGKPLKKFIREGLDVKVCIIRDKACVCPENLSLEMENEEIVNIGVSQMKAREYNVGHKKVWRVTQDNRKIVPIEKNIIDSDPIIVDKDGVVRQSPQPEGDVSTPVGDEKIASESSFVPQKSKKSKKKKKKVKKGLASELELVIEEGSSQSSALPEVVSVAGNDPEPSLKGTGSPANASILQETEGGISTGVKGDGNESGKVTSEEEEESTEVHNVRKKATFDEFMRFSKPAK
ncbi:hypothetical protein LINPERPRIM_LOCUS28172 [Linum perenne]